VLFVPRAARLHLTELVLSPERVLVERAAGDVGCGRILIYSLEGELFFGSAHDLDRHFDTILARAQNGVRVVVLRVKRVRNPDAVCLELFAHFIETLQARGLTFLLCGVRPDFARALHSCGVEQKLGTPYIFHETEGAASSTNDAVRHAYDLLQGDFCATCPRRNEAREVLYYMI
jgi:SulP family sulfate permease